MNVIPDDEKILFMLLIFFLSHTALAKKYEPPRLTANEAIEASKAYVAENKISISEASFIIEVTYKNIYNEYEPAYWSIKWHVVPKVKDGWLEIRIYNSGRIESQYGK